MIEEKCLYDYDPDPIVQLDYQAQAETNMKRVYSIMKDLEEQNVTGVEGQVLQTSQPCLYIRIMIEPKEKTEEEESDEDEQSGDVDS